MPDTYEPPTWVVRVKDGKIVSSHKYPANAKSLRQFLGWRNEKK